MSVNLRGLIGKLNDPTRGALESAAGLCLSRTHYDVEVEHFLMKLLDITGSDLQSLARQFPDVTGPLQNASGVIHVVMEKIEDLTPLLRRLSDAHGAVDIRAHADQARRPIVERHRHPRAGDSLVTLLKEAPELGAELAAQTAGVMPKGRNFH